MKTGEEILLVNSKHLEMVGVIAEIAKQNLK